MQSNPCKSIYFPIQIVTWWLLLNVFTTSNVFSRCHPVILFELRGKFLHGNVQLTITVFEFPPNESCSNRVNFEFRYGMCVLLPSTNALITFPSTDNDKLIFVASFRRMPVAWVLLWRSEPYRKKWKENDFKAKIMQSMFGPNQSFHIQPDRPIAVFPFSHVQHLCHRFHCSQL